MTNSIQDAMRVVADPTIPSVQRFILMARIQRAAKLGDIDAQRFVTLCEINVACVTEH